MDWKECPKCGAKCWTRTLPNGWQLVCDCGYKSKVFEKKEAK